MSDATDRAEVLRISLLHMSYYTAFGFGVPFFTLYFSSLLGGAGVTGVNQLVGVVILLYNGFGVLASPVAGYVSDRFRIGRGILTMSACGVAGATLLFVAPGFFSTLSRAVTVMLVIAGMSIAGFFTRPMVPLINAETLAHLHRHRGEASEYGRFRVAGSVGFIFATSVAGVLIAFTGSLAAPLLLHALGFGLLALIARGKVSARPEPVRLPIGYLREDRLFRRFLVVTFIFSLSVNSGFLYTSFFLDEIGAGFIVMGFALGASALPEIPIMLKAGALLRRFGAKRMISVGVCAQALKLALFSLLSGTASTWLFVLVSLLHGLGFALLYTGAVSLVDARSHSKMRATYQNLFHLVWGAAVAFGGPISALLLDVWDATTLMGIYAVMLLGGLCYFYAIVRGRKLERV